MKTHHDYHRSKLRKPLYGPYGAIAVETARNVRESGANAIWFHGFNAAGFESAATAGVAPCVEFKTFRADFATHPELVPIGVDGEPIRYGRLVQGVCLSRTEFIAEREAELAEGMRVYRPTGVWLDYLTGAGWFEDPAPDLQESCFCSNCVGEFCEAGKVDAESPEVILSRYAMEWTRHKCRRINEHGRRFAAIIREAMSDCLVGVYLCPWRPDEFDGALRRIFAQDYELFAEWVDVFTPLIYAEKSGRPAGWSREFMEASPSFVPPSGAILPILDALDYPGSLESLAESTVAPSGFQLFAGGKLFDESGSRALLAQFIERLRSR